MRLKHITPLLAVAALTVAAHAQTLLVDRGLPTANLNNAAGASRSNVSWGDSTGPYLYGDDFFVDGAGGQTRITNLRLWVVQSASIAAAGFNYTDPTSYQLYLSKDQAAAPALSTVSSTLTISPTSYVGGLDYQFPSGSTVKLLQLDFAVDFVVGPSSWVYFSLGGTGGIDPFVHASNSALSGSTQDYADDMIWEWNQSTLAATNWFSTAGTYWDKGSDFNVQAWGSAVPEPSTYGMIGVVVLAGLVALRRRRA